MDRYVLRLLLMGLGLFPATARAQQVSPHKRAEQIIAAFNKAKHESRVVLGVRKERYKEIRSAPGVFRSAAQYAGIYEVPGSDHVIELQIEGDGAIHGSGFEARVSAGNRPRRFTLTNVRIEGPLLTAKKVYDDGANRPFEGVFIHVTDLEGTSPTRIEHARTTFGLGVLDAGVHPDGIRFDKLLFSRRS